MPTTNRSNNNCHFALVCSLLSVFCVPLGICSNLKSIRLDDDRTLFTLEQRENSSNHEDVNHPESFTIMNNFALTIDSNKFRIEPLFPQYLNTLNIYEPKIIYNMRPKLLSERRNAVYNENDNYFYLIDDNKLMIVNLCMESVVYEIEHVQHTMKHLVIDADKNQLYWIEHSDNDCTIVRWTVPTKQRIIIHQHTTENCHALTLTERALYWLQNGKLYTKSLNNHQMTIQTFKQPLRSNHIVIQNGTTLYFDDTKQQILKLNINNGSDTAVHTVYHAGDDTLLINSFHIIDHKTVDAFPGTLFCNVRRPPTVDYKHNIWVITPLFLA